MTRAREESVPLVRVPRVVGRDPELERLRRALANPSPLVLVEGEAGIGKTRLVQEAVGGRERLLVAVCPPFQDAATLGPVVDAVRQTGVAVAGLGLSGLAGALRPLFPDWADDLPDPVEPLPDATATQHRLLRALAELLDRLDVGLLVVEDAHWADEATLELLLLLTARRPPGAGVLVTYRPEEVADGSLLRRLSSRVRGGSGHLRLALGPLDVADTAALVSSMLDGEHVSDAFARFLHTQTDGLPLALEESVRLLRDRADIVRVDGEWVRRSLDEIAVPLTIRDAVLERVGRLAAPARTVLRAAAVLAEPAEESMLRAVADLPEERARAGIVDAIAGGLLVEDERGRLAFAHVLAARATYDAVPGPIRRMLHGRAGRALEAAGRPSASRLARHFRQTGDTDRWRGYAEQAADLALDVGDDAAAAGHLLDLLESDLPADALTRVADKMPTLASTGYLHRSGLVEVLRSVLDRTSSRRRRAEIRAQLGASLIRRGEHEAAVAELERAVPDLGHDPVRQAHAMTGLGMPYSTNWPATVHRRWLDRAAAVVARSSLPRREVLDLQVNWATGLLTLGDPEGWAVAAGLPDTADAPGEAAPLAKAALNMGNGAMRWGRYGEAREHLARGVRLAEQRGYVRLRDMIAVTCAHLDWFTGRWDGLAERVVRLAELDGEPEIRLDAQTVAGLLDVARGDPSSARERLRWVLEESGRRGLAQVPLEPAAALARLCLAEGDPDGALSLTDAPLRLIAAKGTWLWATELVPARVAALLAAGRPAEAGDVVAGYERGLRDCPAASAHASLADCRARLAEANDGPAAAADAYAVAAAAWDALPRPYAALLVRERQASCLLAAGRRDAGLELLTGVLRGHSRLGATGDAERVAEQLHGHGVRRAWRGGRRGYGSELSPREREVVRLLVTGLGNKEIAQALSRSPKTVAAQINSAMRKLGVSSRTALAVAAVQAGLGTEGLPAEL
ncbi:AAA family ATPase [Nonomuraea phyllanthi]|uniref:AAA family ATPase n=1 Tax=Nonomuraea phyllanthi TaxID=2219224 RepID=A0A5C4VJ02_9ACTN|nr:helix-turn-helix transcriptional regulator [Nonomuraea phyllanthi]KAB8189233.1 AAA family ATPase [Nonomuraea phyllanthi]